MSDPCPAGGLPAGCCSPKLSTERRARERHPHTMPPSPGLPMALALPREHGEVEILDWSGASVL